MIEYNTQAIVLDKQIINEADAQVILYTELLGKIELIAKGAKKITAKLNSHLEILNLIESTIITVNSKHLTSALTINRFSNIRHQEKILENAIKMVKFFNQVIVASEKDEFLWQSLCNYLSELDRITMENEKIDLLAEIPFDRNYAEIYSKGGLVSEENEGISLQFDAMANKILQWNLQ